MRLLVDRVSVAIYHVESYEKYETCIVILLLQLVFSYVYFSNGKAHLFYAMVAGHSFKNSGSVQGGWQNVVVR